MGQCVACLKSMEQGPTFRISVPKYPTKDPNHRILAHQCSRFTHYYFYIYDQVLGRKPWTKWASHSIVYLAVKASLAKALCERSLAKRLSVVAPEFRVHVNHHQKDTIPGYTAELGYQLGQLRGE